MADDGLSPLSDDEKTALAALLERTIDEDRFPLSPRIGQLRGILAKLHGTAATVKLSPEDRAAIVARMDAGTATKAD